MLKSKAAKQKVTDARNITKSKAGKQKVTDAGAHLWVSKGYGTLLLDCVEQSVFAKPALLCN